MESLTLFELNNLVRTLLEQTLDGEYWLEAELAEARLASNGHFYVEFVQKDAGGRNFIARARGIMWARTYHLLTPLFERATGERLRAGMKVRVQVSVTFHEVYGYSLNILDIDPAYTLGNLAQRRREILRQLEADGILEDNRQLPLPLLLKHIAVVSSAGAAGYGDFCDQLINNDYGLHFDVQLFPAVMQGAQVETSVMDALAAVAEQAGRWDCVVVIRGGGATSDLADFDSYALAAAVAQMPMPVIVGIGHERDETVLDFVAHTRVKTPTAAAAFLIDHGAAQLAQIAEWQSTILQGARMKMDTLRQRLERITTLLPRSAALVLERQQRQLAQLAVRLSVAPQQRVQTAAHRMELLHSRFVQSCRMKIQSSQFQIRSFQQRLDALDPVLLLRRGYSMTFTADGSLVTCTAALTSGDTLLTRLADGSVTSTIREIQPSTP